MDGNGRWAAAKGLPRLEGHRRGAERLIEIIDACIDGGIGTLTVFAFSAENWKRPLEEVSGLFKLGEWILRAHLARLEKRNVRLHVIGDITAL
ncbi:MAG: isoprenyl transferase, partial [Verrucomicrobia bacterium]|nr:isoprenyl transferase [Verrucomicrobiota bacterium]